MSTNIKFAASLARVLSNLGFTLVLWNSFKYQVKYLSNIKFDNSYCTPYFRKIDSRRQYKLLPFKKSENWIYYPLEFYISKYQKPLFKFNLFLQITLILTLITSLIVDFVVYDFLSKKNNSYFLEVYQLIMYFLTRYIKRTFCG